MSNQFLDHLVREAEERAAKYREYREYYDGIHHAQLTERQRTYLQIGGQVDFSANYMPIVVDSLANRLEVVGFDGDNADTVWSWWTRNKMDANQFSTHVSAIRDGDSYMLVDWDEDREIPLFFPQTAYDGRSGCTVHYSGETDEPIAATKRWWVEFGEGAAKIRRLNVYYPDRIERFYTTSENTDYSWLPYSEDGFPNVIDWVGKGGEPLGIPVIHFTNRKRGYRYGLSELDPAIPMQNALNKSVIDLLAGADASGFRIWFMAGDDASNVTLGPGAIVNSLKEASDVSFEGFPGEPMRPLIEVVDSFVQRIGQVTDTPLSYFQQSGQMASEGTHESHEARMLTKARVAALEMGTAYEKMMAFAIRLNNEFGSSKYDEESELQTLWADFDARNEVERAKERSEVLLNLVSAGASIREAAIVAGFSEVEADNLAKIDDTVDPIRLRGMMANAEPFAATTEV